MLFNSYYFIGLFLPSALLIFYLCSKHYGARVAIGSLVFSSLFFYGWWNPVYLLLIIASILFNYALGRSLCQTRKYKRLLLGFGVLTNLSALGYFKYANFFVDTIDALLGINMEMDAVVLPLAISFFTFQQITYLVDAYRGETAEYRFSQYCLFVTFFPQLIAGPIVHHREMMPQFHKASTYRIHYDFLALGLSVFILGLFKKVVLADNIAPYSTKLFSAAEQGFEPSLIEAWGGALAYTFQLYFDFSGYSDMAIGLALMFGVRLPLNFNSPYKASNIIDFWRRWHITLSRFLRDYLYIAIGGNRRGQVRRYFNLFLTMLLGGLWHGAGWTFVCWGALHGFYLIINHAWHGLQRWLGIKWAKGKWLNQWLARIITFVAVVVGWVFFRAESFDAAFNVLSGMSGINGIVLPAYLVPEASTLGIFMQTLGVQFARLEYFDGFTQLLSLAALLCIVWWSPNTAEIVAKYQPVCDMERHELRAPDTRFLRWRPSKNWAIFISILLLISLMHMTRISEFLYFQF